MTLERGEPLPRGEVPKPYRVVPTRGGQRAAIWQERQRRNDSGVFDVFRVIRHHPFLLPRLRVPNAEDKHAALRQSVPCGDEVLGFRRKGQTAIRSGSWTAAKEKVG